MEPMEIPWPGRIEKSGNIFQNPKENEAPPVQI